jgi:WXG100 family type VII secretion target
MTRLVVDLAALADLVERLGRVGARLDQARSDVDARVAQLRVEWSGSAAAAQAAAQAEWAGGADEVARALVGLRAIAAGAQANYAAAVEANRRMWAR